MPGFRQSLSREGYWVVACLAAAVTIAAWWLFTYLEIVPARFLPGPQRVLWAGYAMFWTSDFSGHVLASAGRILVAFCASAIAAVPLALAMSSFKCAEGALRPIIEFVRYVPVPAMLPLFIVLTGIGEEPKFLVLFFGTFFQLVLLILDDANEVPDYLFDTVSTMGATTRQKITDVMVPYLMPQIFDRLRIALGWCWTYLVIAELIAVDRGIGRVVKDSQRFQEVDQLFVCFFTLGVIGLATDYVAQFARRRLFPYA